MATSGGVSVSRARYRAAGTFVVVFALALAAAAAVSAGEPERGDEGSAWGASSSSGGSDGGDDGLRAFLSAFYEATGGPYWNRQCKAPVPGSIFSTGCWMNASEPVCNWAGLGCNATGALTEISLVGFNLTGTLPEWGWSAHGSALEVLLVGINALSGAVPVELGSLTALVALDLSYNNFDSSLPMLTALGSLRTINTSFNRRLTGTLDALPLGPASVLNTVEMAYMGLSGTLPIALGESPQLTIVWLPGNAISGTIPPLCQNGAALNYFNTQANQLSGTVPLSLVAQCSLQYLLLSSNQLTSPLPSEYVSYTLLVIDFSNNRFSEPFPIDLLTTYAKHALMIDLSVNNFTGDMNLDETGRYYTLLVSVNATGNPLLRSATPLFAPNSTFAIAPGSQTLFSPVVSCFVVGYTGASIINAVAVDPSYFDFDNCYCSSNTFGNPPNQCEPCPSFATCHGDTLTWSAGVYPQEYSTAAGPVWRLLPCARAKSSVACAPSANCSVQFSLGLTAGCELCAAGFAGRLCSRCAPGFFGVSGTCARCVDGAVLPAVVLGLVLTLLVVLLATYFWQPLQNGDRTYGAVFGTERHHGFRQLVRLVKLLWRESALVVAQAFALVALVVLGQQQLAEVLFVCGACVVITAYLFVRRLHDALLERRLAEVVAPTHVDEASSLLGLPSLNGVTASATGADAGAAAPPSGVDARAGKGSRAPAPLANLTHEFQYVITLMLVYFQCLSALLLAVAVDWAAVVSSVLSVSRAISLQFTSLKCMGLDLGGQYVFVVLLLPTIVTIAAVVYALRLWTLGRALARAIARADHDGSAAYRAEIVREIYARERHELRRRVLALAMLVTYVFFFPLVAASLAWFDCRPDPTGLSTRKWLASAAWFECFTHEHYLLASLAGGVLFVLACVACFAGVLVKRAARARRADSPVVFLFAPFRPVCWGFEAVVLTFRVAIAAVTAVLPMSPFLLPAVTCLVVGMLTVHLYQLPLRSLAANKLAAATYAALGISAVLAVQIQWEQVTDSASTIWLIFALAAVNAGVVAAAMVQLLRPMWSAIRALMALGSARG